MHKKHILLALLAVFLWGASFPLLKGSLADISPLFATTIRLMIIGVFGVALAPKCRLEKPWLIFWLGTSMFSVPLAATSLAMQEVDASIAAIMTELEVVLLR